MRTPILRLNAVTEKSREETIDRVKKSVDACGAWIISVTSFSNMSICFNFEIPGASVQKLRDALTQSQLRLSSETVRDLEGLIQQRLSRDIAGSLQITLVNDEPDLKIPVPPIPG